MLRLRKGDEVSLLALDKGSLRPGDRAAFFARGWLLGEAIGLQEVGRSRLPEAALRPLVARARRALEDEDLRARLSGAVLVLSGRVAEIRQGQEPAIGASEHDPAWNKARLEPKTVIAGPPASGEVILAFPGSDDVAWREAPRPRVGQEAIWILHTGEAGLTALDPLDVQPLSEASRIVRLLMRKRP
jgi:hypothetical protein